MFIPEGKGVFALILGDGDAWQQQCGGYACRQEYAAGVLVEIADRSIEDKLHDYFTGDKWGGWCSDGIDEDTAEFIEQVIPQFAVDRAWMRDSCEAWIYGTYAAKDAVLVWGNSD